MAGNLFIIATPIGNLADISDRARKTLASADLILAEDTRHSKRLLDFYKINTKLKSLHEHNEERSISWVLDYLKNHSVALISDAGTPLISDPGFKLVRAVKRYGFKVQPIPGPSALIAALSASGLPTDRFKFEGFVPKASKAREDFIFNLMHETHTSVFYESPKRIIKTLSVMNKLLEPARLCTVARELSKKHESIITDTIEKVYEIYADGKEPAKGELVIIIAPDENKRQTDTNLTGMLAILLEDLAPSKAAKIGAKISGASKNQLYQLALELIKDKT